MTRLYSTCTDEQYYVVNDGDDDMLLPSHIMHHGAHSLHDLYIHWYCDAIIFESYLVLFLALSAAL